MTSGAARPKQADRQSDRSPRRSGRARALALVFACLLPSPAAARTSVTVQVAVAGGAGALAWGLALTWSDRISLTPGLQWTWPLGPESGREAPEPLIALPVLVIPFR